MEIKIEVEGITEVISDLKALSKDLASIPAMTDVAKAHATIAASLAPVKTGFLANSIRPTVKDNKAGAIAAAPYSAVINYGSPKRGITPTHFMNRADSAIEPKAVSLIDSGVQDLIDDRGLG